MIAGCPTRAELQSYLSDTLAPEREKTLVSHVEGCVACRQALDSLTTDPYMLPHQTLHPAPEIRSGFRERLAQALPAPRKSDMWMNLSAMGNTPVDTVTARDTLTLAAPEGKPARLGGYEILEELGRGGMGVVYLARDTKLGRLVALKLIRGDDRTDREQQARFLAEAQAIAQLRHPHIVQLYELGTLEGRQYCALEYVAGGSLARQLDGRPLPPPQAAALLELLARAMDHAHQQGIIHRDLKPANVLLMPKEECRMSNELDTEQAFDIRHSSFGIPKITDFGLAKRLDTIEGLTQTGVVVGTPSYMAPEQASTDRGPVGPAADIYALGVILYECLTGRPPFLGASTLETLDALLHEEPVPPRRLGRQVPRDLETICLKCLHKEPPRRYATAAALADDLGRFQRGEPIQARPVPAPERLWRWCRRNPLAAAFLVTLTVSVIAMAALVWWIVQERGRADEQAQHAQVQARLAEEKRREADHQRQEANQRRADALANLAQAREAVDNCYRVVQEHPLFQGDAHRDRRALLLEQARPFYERFMQQRSDDPDVLAGQAEILWKLSDIYSVVGPREKSLAALEKAGVVYEQLCRQQPRALRWQFRLAAIWLNRGTEHHRLHHLDDAMTCFLEAEKRHRQIIEALPGDLNQREQILTRQNLVTACQNQGVLHRDHGRLEEALAGFTNALNMQEALMKNTQGTVGVYSELANILQNLAIVYLELHRYPDSQRCHFRARKIWEQLAAQFPNTLRFPMELGRTWYGLGLLYDAMGRRQDALDAYQQAGRFYESVLTRQPQMIGNAVFLGGTYCNLARLLVESGDYAQGDVLYGKARHVLRSVLAREPRQQTAKEYLGNVHWGHAHLLKLQGRHTSALAEWSRWAALSKNPEASHDSPKLKDCREQARLEQSAWIAESASLPASSPPLVQLSRLAFGLQWGAPPRD